MESQIKLVCFDLDNTLIAANSWERLNLALGITAEEDTAMYKQFKAGSLSYTDWLDRLVTLYQERSPADRATVERVLGDYTLRPDARETVAYLQSAGYAVAIVSGSFKQLVRQVAEDLGIAQYRASSEIVYTADDTIDRIAVHGDPEQRKVDLLREITAELDIALTECAYVGDGRNDLAAFAATEHGITFKKSKVAGQAWKRIDEIGDLQTLL